MTPNATNVVLSGGQAPGASAAARRASLEMPTLLLAFAVYGAWLAITFAWRFWPLIIVAPLGAMLVTLQGSLQHEVVHGHPTRWGRFNRLLAIVPLSLYLPYERYRASHLAHHIDPRLTDPLDDPESFYWTREAWARLGPLGRTIVRVQQTLAGRVTLGAFWSIGRFLHAEGRAVIANLPGVRRVWLEHLLWCAPVVAWVTLVCGMPLWVYALTMAVPATSLTLIRSFAEHRARPQVRARVALVEGSWILGPLYLFNNLHALHHEAPGIPWYRYPACYRLSRERLIAENGGLVYRTYFEVARRYLFCPHDVPLHPTDRVPPAST
jgi:fatty acid desaturase